MLIDVVSEFNDNGILMQFPEYFGAFTRGETEEIAFHKTKQELYEYAAWAKLLIPKGNIQIVNSVRARNDLRIDNADSEVLLDYDRVRLCKDEFKKWRTLTLEFVLKSVTK